MLDKDVEFTLTFVVTPARYPALTSNRKGSCIVDVHTHRLDVIHEADGFTERQQCDIGAGHFADSNVRDAEGHLKLFIVTFSLMTQKGCPFADI